VAHEINNPLAYILANLQHLSAEIRDSAALSAADKEALQEVVRESLDGSYRARDIVRDLRSLSPREQGKLEPVEIVGSSSPASTWPATRSAIARRSCGISRASRP
jgi:signal transduction histidine kinase